jgi:hypothetical protein
MIRVALALLLAGCAAVPKTAVVDGKEVPRLTLEYGGQPFTVKHEGAHPRPGGPSDGLRDSGGSIRGRVCGMLVDLDVNHRGDRVEVVGSLDNHISVAITVSEKGGVRQFTGNLGNAGVEFALAPDDMKGHVGVRVFALEATGDLYQGRMRIPGLLGSGTIGVQVGGKSGLWSMPPADQAAVLPAIMTCSGIQFTMVGGLIVGFGGTVTDRPPETSSLYTKF